MYYTVKVIFLGETEIKEFRVESGEMCSLEFDGQEWVEVEWNDDDADMILGFYSEDLGKYVVNFDSETIYFEIVED